MPVDPLRLLEDWRKALDNHQSAAAAAAVLMDLSLNIFNNSLF